MNETGYVKAILGDANSNVPVSRRTIIEHLDKEDFTYKTRSGSLFSMDRAEVESLAELCTETDKLRLRLPIIISTDQRSWKVEGKVETSVISKILKKKSYRDDYMRFYNPHFAELRKKYPTTVVIAFIP